MRPILLITLLNVLSGVLLFGQSAEYALKDAKTGEAIPFAYVMATRQTEKFETISNSEGRINLPIGCDSITTSHVAYENLHVSLKSNRSLVLLLIPKITELANLTVYGIDLKEKIKYVLKHFSRLYIRDEQTYRCTYKETYKVDDSLARLLQFNMKWWDQDYKCDVHVAQNDQNAIGIETVSYSRTREGKTVYSGALTNKSLFEALHLYYYLTALFFLTQDLRVYAIEKTNTSTKMLFDGSLQQSGKAIGDLRNCYFIFDNKTNAILQLHTQLISLDRTETFLSRGKKIPVTIKYKGEERTMSFLQDKKKLRLSYFEFAGESEDKIQDTVYYAETKLGIYITGLEKGNTISGTTRIPLGEVPICEFIKNTPKSDPTILLTHKEQEFIRGKNDD